MSIPVGQLRKTKKRSLWFDWQERISCILNEFVNLYKAVGVQDLLIAATNVIKNVSPKYKTRIYVIHKIRNTCGRVA